jgi:hypothetical protein
VVAPELVEIVATVALFGYLNRWNDTMATDLEEHPCASGGPRHRRNGLDFAGNTLPDRVNSPLRMPFPLKRGSQNPLSLTLGFGTRFAPGEQGVFP